MIKIIHIAELIESIWQKSCSSNTDSYHFRAHLPRKNGLLNQNHFYPVFSREMCSAKIWFDIRWTCFLSWFKLLTSCYRVNNLDYRSRPCTSPTTWELHAAVGFSISLPRSHLPSLNPWDTELTCLSSRNWTIKKEGGLRVMRLSCSRVSCGCIRSETWPIENLPRYILTREQNTKTPCLFTLRESADPGVNFW